MCALFSHIYFIYKTAGLMAMFTLYVVSLIFCCGFSSLHSSHLYVSCLMPPLTQVILAQVSYLPVVYNGTTLIIQEQMVSVYSIGLNIQCISCIVPMDNIWTRAYQLLLRCSTCGQEVEWIRYGVVYQGRDVTYSSAASLSPSFGPLSSKLSFILNEQ